MNIYCAGATDVGKKRKTNQDSIFTDSELAFFAVADGMGGHNGGDIASQTTVESFPSLLKKHKGLSPRDLLISTIQSVNSIIYKKAQNEPALKGMGTTISSVFFGDTQAFIANVGDSRCYLVRNKQLFQLSKDHSLVQEKINMGLYNREAAKKDRMKNVLVRTVGFEPNVEVDVFSYEYFPEEIFLICSDGLHGMVSDHDILHIVSEGIPEPSNAGEKELESVANQLIDQANENGGHDNISVILCLVKND